MQREVRVRRKRHAGGGSGGGRGWLSGTFFLPNPPRAFSRVCTHSLTRLETFHLLLHRSVSARTRRYKSLPYEIHRLRNTMIRRNFLFFEILKDVFLHPRPRGRHKLEMISPCCAALEVGAVEFARAFYPPFNPQRSQYSSVYSPTLPAVHSSRERIARKFSWH